MDTNNPSPNRIYLTPSEDLSILAITLATAILQSQGAPAHEALTYALDIYRAARAAVISRTP